MSVIVEVDLRTPVLSEALSAVPETSVRLVQESLLAERRPRLMFWAMSPELDRFETAMENDWTVAEFALLASDGDDRAFYRATLTRAVEEYLAYGKIVELDGVVVDSVGSANEWIVRAQFPNRDAVAELHDYCEAHGMPIQIRRLFSMTDSGGDPETSLTEVQREVLELALECGYFDVPRRTTTNELGEQLGISGQAVSERLRRALKKATTEILTNEQS